MEAIGNYVVLEEILETSIKTEGGLELAEKHREDIRYRKANIISSGPSVLKKGQTVFLTE